MSAYRDLDRTVTEWLNDCDLHKEIESSTGLRDVYALMGEFDTDKTALNAFAVQICPISIHFTVDLVPIAVVQDLMKQKSNLFPTK